MHLVPRPEVLFVACVYMIVHVHVCIQYYAELHVFTFAHAMLIL